MSSEHIQIGDVSPVIRYAGDGVQVDFTYPFPIFAASDLKVYLGDSTVPEASGYVVGGAGESTGGTVTFSAAPLVDQKVTLARELPIERTSDFQEGEFRAKVLNDEFDKIIAQMQELRSALGSALRLATTDDTDISGGFLLPDATARAGNFLSFDGNGVPIATPGVSPSDVPVSSFWAAILDDADAVALPFLGAQGDGSGLSGVAKPGPQTIWIPAQAFTPNATAGPVPATLELATNGVMLNVLEFDQAVAQNAQFMIAMPKSWDVGTLTAQAVWTAGNGTGDVVWSFRMNAFGDDDPGDAAWGAAVAVTDTRTAVNRILFSEVTAAITPGGSSTEGDVLALEVSRDAANGADTLNFAARLIGVRLLYSTESANDA